MSTVVAPRVPSPVRFEERGGLPDVDVGGSRWSVSSVESIGVDEAVVGVDAGDLDGTAGTGVSVVDGDSGPLDVVEIRRDANREILSSTSVELLEYLRDTEVESVTALAEALGRDKAAVSRDLDLLGEESLVDFEHEGRRKIPVVWHETVLVEPIL